MKKITLFIFYILLYTNNGIAQCQNKESVPEEMLRGRYQEADMTYGNPYTMFVRGYDFDITLNKKTT